jgi:hypothetical protein
MFEDGPKTLNLYGSTVINEDRTPGNPENYPVSQIVSFQELARPVIYADLIVVKGEFLSSALNFGEKKIGICLIGNLAPVKLGE